MQSNAGYPSQPQRPHVVVVGSGQQQQHPTVVQQSVQSYTVHIITACVVLFLGNWVFGLVALYLAG